MEAKGCGAAHTKSNKHYLIAHSLPSWKCIFYIPKFQNVESHDSHFQSESSFFHGQGRLSWIPYNFFVFPSSQLEDKTVKGNRFFGVVCPVKCPNIEELNSQRMFVKIHQILNIHKPSGRMISSCWASPVCGHKPETNNHFLFHSIGILHLKQELEVIVVDPFVLNNIVILKITHLWTMNTFTLYIFFKL